MSWKYYWANDPTHHPFKSSTRNCIDKVDDELWGWMESISKAIEQRLKNEKEDFTMIKCKKEDGIKLTDHNLSGIIQKLVEGGYEIDCDRTNDRIELKVYRVSRRDGRGKLFTSDQFIKITNDKVEWGDESRGYKAYYLYNEFSDVWLPKLYDAKNIKAFTIMHHDSDEIEIIDKKLGFHRCLVEDTILVFDDDNNFVELLKCEVNPGIVLEDNGYEVVS